MEDEAIQFLLDFRRQTYRIHTEPVSGSATKLLQRLFGRGHSVLERGGFAHAQQHVIKNYCLLHLAYIM